MLLIVYAVTYDCLDFYCDREHLFGIFTTEQKAKDAISGALTYWQSRNTVGTENFEYEYSEWTLDALEGRFIE